MRFIALYFALQLLGRVLVSPNLELDEAEQVFLLQNLEFGYGLQPPFYTWLQALFFYAFGPSVFSLSLLKNLLLFGIYASLYWSARQVFEKKQAIAITLGLAFFPQILWEAQRDLSHTVLLSFCIAAFIGMIVKGVKSGFTGPIVVGLALCTAIGIQAKYSFAVFAGAFFLALVSQPESRTLLFSRPMPLARLILFLLVVFVVTFPHGQWLIDNWQVVQEPLRHKVFLQHDTGVGQGLYNLLVASLGFIAFIFISVLLALPIRRGGTFERPLWVKTELQQRVMALLIAYSAALVFVLLALVLLFDVHQIKDRWLQPFLVMLPFLVFLGFPALRSGLQRVWLWGAAP